MLYKTNKEIRVGNERVRDNRIRNENIQVMKGKKRIRGKNESETVKIINVHLIF